MDFSTLLLLISLVLASISVFHHARRQRSASHKLPPGPTPLPIVGSLFKLGSKPNESLAELAKTYGPIFSIRLGTILTVVVSSPDTAKEVLQKHDQALAGRPILEAVRALDFHKRTMGWQPPNPHWRKLRMMYNIQIFSIQRLDADQAQALRRQKVQELVAYARKKSLLEQPLHISQLAFVTSLNILSNTIMSVNLADLDSESDSAREFQECVHGATTETARPNLVDYFPILRWVDPQGVKRRMVGYLSRMYEIFDAVIEERLQSRASAGYQTRNDLLDVLLDHSQDEDLRLSRTDIKSLLTEIFIAGTDTNVTTVEWAMAELLRDPQMMAKARSELKEAIGRADHGKKQAIEESDINRLPFFQAIVKETLRLHPPAPLLLPHRAEDTVQICGYTLPKHTQVLVNTWALNRDAGLWADPFTFWPERFLRSGNDIDIKGKDFRFIPFGAGRKICPGMNLGLRMVHLMLASLLHFFAWRLPDGMVPEDMNMNDKFGLTLQMAVPLRAVPVLDDYSCN